jgi:hypothetical protein
MCTAENLVLAGTSLFFNVTQQIYYYYYYYYYYYSTIMKLQFQVTQL